MTNRAAAYQRRPLITRERVVCAAVLALLATAAPPAPTPAAEGAKPLTVGWHDEFNVLEGWAPWTAGGGSDVLRGDVGKLTIVLGKTAIYMPEFRHYRAGVYRDFDVDLDRYPIAAVRVLRLHDAAQWDAQILQYREPGAPDARDLSLGGGIPVPGNPEGLVADPVGESKDNPRAALVFVDLRARHGALGKERVRLLLNVSGPVRQGYADFAWVRFLRREDVPSLRAHPDRQDITEASD